MPLAAESFVDVGFPLGGVDLSRGFSRQRQGTAVSGTNARAFEQLTLRGRGGSRPGLAKWIPGQLPSGSHLVQHLNTIVVNDGPDLSGVAGVPSTPYPGFALLDLDEDDLPGVGGVMLDPSSDGPSSSWGVFQNSRNPGRTVRIGGNGRARFKNKKKKVKKTPLVFWADPSPISPYTTLSATQLNAVAKDPDTLVVLTGTFVYTPDVGASLSAGENQLLSVSFTPDDTADYDDATGTAHINVRDIVFVQANVAGYGSFANPRTVAFLANVTQGNLLVVAVDQERNATVSVSDTRGNTWTLAGTATHGNLRLRVWYAIANATGACTVSYANTTGRDYGLAVLEYSGVNAATPLDTAAPGDGTEFAGLPFPFVDFTTKPIAVAGTGRLVLAFFGQDWDVLTAGSISPAGYTSRVNQTNGTPNTSMALYAYEKTGVGTSQTVSGSFSGFDGGTGIDFGLSFNHL